jgi:hypothetical protein
MGQRQNEGKFGSIWTEWKWGHINICWDAVVTAVLEGIAGEMPDRKDRSQDNLLTHTLNEKGKAN